MSRNCEATIPMRILITSTFLLLALWFATLSGVGAIPIEEQPAIPAADIAPLPRRSIMLDPPTTRIGSLEKKCNDCHAIFPSSADEPAERLQHVEVVLEHGLNNRCANCHDKGDHDKLVLYGGKQIGYAEVQLLCAKCHGPTYRDWQAGIHGKTLGSWEQDNPERHHLVCTECHDPHHPAFPPYVPLRGPHTLRQHATEQKHGTLRSPKRNPLRHWQETTGHEATSESSH